MEEQNQPKPGFFKRLFDDLYEVTIIFNNGKKKVYMFKEINKKSNTFIKGRDENGHKFEISTPEPFTFFYKEAILMNTGFYGIFKDKLKKQKEALKEELEKAKTDRRKDWLKQQIKETKSLQKSVKQMEKEMDIKTCCPNCGCEL